MIGTLSKLVSIVASWALLEAVPRAVPNAIPPGVSWIGLKTVKLAWPREWIDTGPDAVTVREATSPLTTSSRRISPACGTNRTPVDCSTVLRPRTGRPSTKSCTVSLVTVDSGNIRSTNSRCTATRTFAAW